MKHYTSVMQLVALSNAGFLTVMLSSGHNSESTGRDIFWRCKASCERRKRELPREGGGGGSEGMPPPGNF